jgi:replicative DNA helicase
MSSADVKFDFIRPASAATISDGVEAQIPFNIEAEMALLGALLLNNEVYDRVSSFLRPEHFSQDVHARIFSEASKLINSGRLANPVTLKTYFEYDETIEELGGASKYLASLAAQATTIVGALDYAKQVTELATRRSLITLGGEIIEKAVVPTLDPPYTQIIEEAEAELYKLAEAEKFGQGFLPFGTALTEAIDMAAAAYQRDGGLSGISTGLKDLDEKLGGLQASDLIILAGRPAMGKTSLATNLAYNVAAAYRAEHNPDGTQKVTNGGIVAFFSLEMSGEQLATRIISEQAEISSERIRRGKITPDEFDRLVEVSQRLAAMPLYIDATGGLTIAQVAARARRLKRQRGTLGLIVVDYLQLLAGSARRASESRVQEVTEITTGLKALAKELNVPIIALSQLSRQVENRDDKRPQLADLRESGSIEQDADVVMFIYREEYYLGREEPKPNTEEHLQWQERMDQVVGISDVIIGKQRHGPTGTVSLHFDANLTKFTNLVRPGYVPDFRD